MPGSRGERPRARVRPTATTSSSRARSSRCCPRSRRRTWKRCAATRRRGRAAARCSRRLNGCWPGNRVKRITPARIWRAGDVTSYHPAGFCSRALALFHHHRLAACRRVARRRRLTAYDQMNKDKIAEGVTVGGVEVGGMTRSEARDEITRDMRLRARQAIVVRDGTAHFRLTPRAMGAQFDVDGMVDDAIARSREGNIFARTYAGCRRTVAERRGPGARDLLEARARRLLEPGRSARSTARPWTLPRVRGRQVRARARQARRARQLPPRTRSSRRDHRPGAGDVHVKARRSRPKVTMATLAGEPDARRRRPPALQATPLQEPQAGQDLRDRHRPVRLDTPAGQYHIEDKTIDPAWYVPERRLGGQPGRPGHSGRRAREPAQGALAGLRRRRRHPRHRRRSARSAAPPRTAASACTCPTSRRSTRVPLGAPLYIA